MFRYSARRIAQIGEQESFDKNTHLECFLLHFRNLIEFFGRPNPRDDDLHITKPGDFWNGQQQVPGPDVLRGLSRRGAELWQKYEDGEAKRDRISKYLHHCTKSRTEGKDWEVGTMYNELEELATRFLELVPDRSRHWPEVPPARIVGPASNSTATVT